MNLPFGVDVSEKWFINLWNYTLIPYLNNIVKMKEKVRENFQSYILFYSYFS